MKQIKNEDDVTTVSYTNAFGTLRVLPDNAQSIGCRDQQQDYFAYSDLLSVATIEKIGCAAVLADGMGGLQNGREAAVAGVEAFLQYYETAAGSGQDVPTALEDAVAEANRAVLQYPHAGSTLIGAVIKENCLHFVSVGDSRIYLFRKGFLRKLNKEHTYAEELDAMCARGEISVADAMYDPERKALTSYLGQPTVQQICAVSGYRLLPQDIVILCSDGLYNTLDEAEIAEVLTETEGGTAEALVTRTLHRQNVQQDNITVVLLKIL